MKGLKEDTNTQMLKKKGNKKSRYLVKVYRSRSSYFFIYMMIITLLSSLGYSYYIGKHPSKIAFMLSGIFTIIAIYSTEIHRVREWWAITETSLVHSVSIFNKNVREVDFSSISDLDLDQPFIKRILNHGTVNVRLFLNETSIKIINIDEPAKFIEFLQKTMAKSRIKKHGIRKI